MHAQTLQQYLASAQSQQQIDHALAEILLAVAKACQEISAAIRRGSLTGVMGNLNQANIQGEMQKQLDVICNEIFIEAVSGSGYVAGLVSEELEKPHLVEKPPRQKSHYLLACDPLDGSSNVNVNISVGTIFSVLPCPADCETPIEQDFLQAGTQQRCAGYALYGTSTMLAFTFGHGVDGFTLDEETQTFYLTHPQMRIPAEAQEFAINMSNYRHWETPVRHYIDECLQGKDGVRGKDFNMRWVASMVADVHRILTRGGVFLYPLDEKIRAQSGKLRLLYEANPISYIVEQAGGAATTGDMRILEVQPDNIHQRVPVMLGAKNEVESIIRYHQAAIAGTTFDKPQG